MLLGVFRPLFEVFAGSQTRLGMTPTPAGLMDFKLNITTGVCLLNEGLMDFKLNINTGVCLLNEGLMDFKLNITTGRLFAQREVNGF